MRCSEGCARPRYESPGEPLRDRRGMCSLAGQSPPPVQVSAAGIRIVYRVATRLRCPLPIATVRARRQMLRGLHLELVAALRTDVGAGGDVTTGGNRLSHFRVPR